VDFGDLAGLGDGGPELPPADDFDVPIPDFEENPLQAPWEAEAPSTPIKELPKAPEVAKGKRKRIIFDTRTELSGKSMEKLVNDPSPLFRELKVAPATREEIDLRRRELEVGLTGMFDDPVSIPDLPPRLAALLRAHARAQPGLEGQPQEPLSIEQARGADFEEAPEPAWTGGEAFDVPAFEPADEEAVAGSERKQRRATGRGDGEAGAEALSEELAPLDMSGAEGRGFTITRRTKEMHDFLAERFKRAGGPKPALVFQHLFNTREKAALAFFELLNIKSKGCVDVKQEAPYGDITISKTKDFQKLTA